MQKQTALITGATSGIGEALAKVYAKANYHLILTGRNSEKLAELKTQFENIDVISADLNGDGVDVILNYLNEHSLTVDVLINNAGLGLWSKFIDSDVDRENMLLNVHIPATLKLTRALLKPMLELKRGQIVFVGSVYSYTPVPKQAVYAASKSFLLSFSSALRSEVKNQGVKVNIICPGITKTNFRGPIEDKPKRGGSVSMTAEQVAQYSFKKLQQNKAVIIPGLFNKVYTAAGKCLPINAVTAIVDWLVYKVRGLKTK